MKNRLGLILLMAFTLPAHAGETADMLAKRVTFPVPEGLCAMPTNESGNIIFSRLDQIQRDIGNRLIVMFPTCEDAERIKAGQEPAFRHYAAVATMAQSVTTRIDVPRAQVIAETAAQLDSAAASDKALELVGNAEKSLQEIGVRDIELVQPVSYIGQDDVAVYALMRQRVNGNDKDSLEVMGVLSASGFNGVPVFVYYYDSPPAKESSVRLYAASKAYLAQLDSQNILP